MKELIFLYLFFTTPGSSNLEERRIEMPGWIQCKEVLEKTKLTGNEELAVATCGTGHAQEEYLGEWREQPIKENKQK